MAGAAGGATASGGVGGAGAGGHGGAGGIGGAGGGVVGMCGRIRCDCTFMGKNLWGKVRIVQPPTPATFKIEVVTNFLTDLKVKKVPAPGLTTRCGEWQEVTALEDFSVQVVQSLGDFRIQYVDSLPGVAGSP